MSEVATGATLEPTWCPSCTRHGVDEDGYCTACGSMALLLARGEDGDA